MEGDVVVSIFDELGILKLVGALAVFILYPLVVSWVKDKIANRKKKIFVDGKPVSVHYNCPNYQDIEVIVDRAIEKASKIFDIRHYQVVHEQMVVTDRMFINLKDVTLQSYKDLYKTHGFDEHDQYRRDLRAFEKIYDYVSDNSRKVLREWVRNNHLTEKSEPEFLAYVKDTTHTLMVNISSGFDSEYWSEDFLVPREELKKWNYDHHVGEVETMIEGCLYSVREIARIKDVEIAELEKEDIFK